MGPLFNVDVIAEWLRSYGVWAILISLLINILISILGLVPTLFLSGANAVVFGFIPGFFLSLAGEALGAAVSFWLYRWGFGKQKKVKKENWKWLQRFNEAGRSRRAMILFIARLTPLIPSGVITFAAAISRMPFTDFFLITSLGKAPSIALETMVGHDLIRIGEYYPRLLISLFCLLLIYLLYRKKRI
ncbi:TVP38/TMEM64 family protein [Marinicrinis lubricantis]|uniref:TVP38/TMEM64 family membrane protein n=1 Tax=Marinicrinis lubricantis TaxID=2086470 RepID=A0ABW1ISQ3_9BACL